MRRVFYSFHYQNDNWRVQQIRNIGRIEKSPIANSNEWEEVKRKGDFAIKKWIDENLIGCSCLVVLIGSETANRKYVQYEIEQAWNRGMGVCGVFIHKINDQYSMTSSEGKNPFKQFKFSRNCLKTFNPPTFNPNDFLRETPYNQIAARLNNLIEDAIEYREKNNEYIEKNRG